MPQWYKNNRKLFREERKAVASAYSLLRLAVVYPTSYQIPKDSP